MISIANRFSSLANVLFSYVISHTPPKVSAEKVCFCVCVCVCCCSCFGSFHLISVVDANLSFEKISARGKKRGGERGGNGF